MSYCPADINDRIHAANREFETFDFGRWEVEDSSGWKHDSFDGDLVKTVYFTNKPPIWEDVYIPRPSLKGFFTVRFEQGTDTIRDSFCTVNGNEIIPTVE